MNTNLIKLSNDLFSFNNNCHLDIIKEEYNFKGTINSLFNSILPQENLKYSFSQRELFYNNILKQLELKYTEKENIIILLFCLLRSYGSALEEQMDNIIKKYQIIQNYKSTTKYLDYIKYQVEFQIFCFIVLSSEKEYPQEFVTSLKEQIDKGNIIFKNYC